MYSSTAVVCIVPLFVDHAKVEEMKRCMICMGINDVGKAIPVSTIRHSQGLRRVNSKNATKLSDLTHRIFGFGRSQAAGVFARGNPPFMIPSLPSLLTHRVHTYIHYYLFIFITFTFFQPNLYEVLPSAIFWTSRGHRCRPVSPPVRAFVFIAHTNRVKHSQCSSIFIECCLLTLSSFPLRNRFQWKKKSLRVCALGEN